MEKYKVLLYPEQFSTKEEAVSQMGRIKNRILDYPKDMTARELADAILGGHPISFGYGVRRPGCKDSYKETSWISQQVFGIDIDNEEPNTKEKTHGKHYLKVQDILDICNQNDRLPAFIYETMNSRDTWRRYRVVWILDEPVTNLQDREEVTGSFVSMFASNADTHCTDAARIFFGARKGSSLCYSSSSLISLSSILRKAAKKAGKETSAKPFLNHISTLIQEVETVKKGEEIPQIALEARDTGTYSDSPKDATHNTIYCFQCGASAKSPKPRVITGSMDNLCAFFRNLPLDEVLLGHHAENNISCILPDHKDDKPSAHFYQKNGEWRYHCFGCNKTYDIFNIIMHFTGCTYSQSIRYLCRKFNIQFGTEWQMEKREELYSLQRYIHTESFEKEYSVLYRMMKRSNLFGVYEGMIGIAAMYLINRTIEGDSKAVFYLPLSEIVHKLRSYGVTKAKKYVSKGLRQLARYGLIEIIGEREMDHCLLARLKQKQDDAYRFRINVYHVPEFHEELFLCAEEQILKDKKNSVRQHYFCRDEAMMEDEETALRSYSQFQNADVREEAQRFYKRYQSATAHVIAKKGYTCEEEILSHIKGFSQKDKKRLSGICLPKLLKELRLQRKAFSKAIEEKYQVTSTRRFRYRYGSSHIIIPEEE